MTPKVFFNIVLKILGIFILKDFLDIIPQIASIPLYFTGSGQPTIGIWATVSVALTLVVLAITAYGLIFKSDLLISKLRLEKGFDQDPIPVNIHRSTIFRISIIVLGGIILVDEIPNFCRQLFAYCEENRMTYGHANPRISYLVMSGVKILIGILLLLNQRRIVNFIEWQSKKKAI